MPKVITPLSNLNIVKPISKEEDLEVIRSLDLDKASSLDGFSIIGNFVTYDQ